MGQKGAYDHVAAWRVRSATNSTIRVIRALPGMLGEHPQTIYIVIGDGDDRPPLEALASEVGVRERVDLSGFLALGELPHHHRSADLFIIPSTGEGVGIPFLEPTASGVSVIGGKGDGGVESAWRWNAWYAH